MEKTITYSTKKTYHTLGELSSETKSIWVVIHGYGQLSEYFIRNFEGLNLKDNYIISPQAPAKFYMNNDFSRVGASWLTKENLTQEIENNIRYLDNLFAVECKEVTKPSINLLGFSQGVSMAIRWAAKSKIQFKKLVIWAGTLPKELGVDAFSYLEKEPDVFIVIGDKDVFFNGTDRLESEVEKINKMFSNVTFIEYDGGHKIDKKIIKELLDK